MAEANTQRGYPLPSPDNVAREDAVRIRNAIEQISDDMTGLEERNVVASEDAFGSVRLATDADRQAGVAADRVLTVKRTKDMISALLSSVQTTLTEAMDALEQATAGQLNETRAEVDLAVEDLNSSVATQLEGFTTTLAGKFDKTGGKLSGAVDIDNAPGNTLSISGKINGAYRWMLALGAGGDESGSNGGSNLQLNRHNDAGAYLGTAIGINRATGDITLGGQLTSSYNVAGYDIRANRGNGQGYVFFGAGSNYIGFDGANFSFTNHVNSPAGRLVGVGEMQNYVANVRMVYAGDFGVGINQVWESGSVVVTGCWIRLENDVGVVGTGNRGRYLQYYIPNAGWINTSFA
jgi:hypothetical protein